MKLVYLDNNATTKVAPEALEAMLPYLKDEYGNPSSIYDLAHNANEAIKNAREVMADFLGASDPKEIIFTSCGSESANMAIKGTLDVNRNKKHIITTKVEHPCVLNLYKDLEKKGYRVSWIDVDSNSELNVGQLLEAITPDTALVSVMMANNETGTIYPVDKIAQAVKMQNPETKVFVDGVQAAGKIPVDLKNTKIDMFGISGHKFHAPKGVGALYVKSGTMLSPLIVGGHQERGKRAGTENVPYIVAMAAAAKLAKENLGDELTRVKALRDKLERGILSNIKNAVLNSKGKNRVPNTTNIGFQYVEGELILLHLNDFGICASSGSACTSGSLEPSHVLRAQNVPFTSLHGSIRFSLSRYTTEEEIDYTLEKLPAIIEKIVKISPFQKELKEIFK
ncbi:TPA: cysteine desulfurase NifS [Candidatus Galligastranaerophilus intestinavium]|uniref:Cysteine desulfurase n=1 Tax=Candidatus Galligastranaerophilus intestinavium TaxID=2840836 RepID=A0A9D1FIN3_9BACT|nr:cysteine desulfurase NifS [Candidatus Galligastranaerophilus intestinavium]